MPDRRDDPVLLQAAACIPIPEAMILMLCQPDSLAADSPANDSPVTARQWRVLNAAAFAMALAVAVAAIVARLAPPG